MRFKLWHCAILLWGAACGGDVGHGADVQADAGPHEASVFDRAPVIVDRTPPDGDDEGQDTSGERVPKVHRAVATTCPSTRAAGDQNENWETPGDTSLCQKDSDCASGANGRCQLQWDATRNHRYACTYDECFADDACRGGVCLCRVPGSVAANRCVGGNCRIDSDCPGQYCSPSYLLGCGGMVWISYYCHTPEDECIDDSDCAEDGSSRGQPYCEYNPAVAHWVCSWGSCLDGSL